MKKKLLCILLSLTMVFTYSFSATVFAGSAKLKNIKITKSNYDIKDGVMMSWNGVKGAQKYCVLKNAKKIKTIKATKKNKSYTFKEKDTVYDGDLYSVCATKKGKIKQYYNKNTKKWQTKKPAKKYIGKSRTKTIQKVFATSKTLPIKYNSGDNGEGGATDIQYYTDENGNITGYKGFNIAGVNYFDVSNNKDISVNKTYWKDFVSNGIYDKTTLSIAGIKMNLAQSLLNKWAIIADGFLDQYGDYKTHIDSWQTDYHGKYNERLYYTSDMAAKNEKKRSGDGDCCRRTGILTANSFSEVRNKMGDEVKKAIDRHALNEESEKILGNANLDVLNDKTPRDIIYTVGTNVDNEKIKYKHRYSAHAIILYDFALEPIIDGNLETIDELTKYKTLQEAIEGEKVQFNESDKVVYADNDSLSPVTMTKTSGSTYSNSLSTTMTNSETISYGQSVQSSTKLKITDFIEQTFTIGFTWGQAYTSSKSKGETKTETVSDQQSVSVSVPAQTTLGVREQNREITTKYSFRTPMRVTYKVCIANLAGKVYADSGAVCDFKSYDQGASAFFFGEGGHNGENALDSLEKRAIDNKNNKEYDNVYGKVYTYKNKSKRENEGIDWSKVTEDCKNAIDKILYNQPIISNGGIINVTSKGIKYTIDEPIPLYKLTAVRINTSKKDADQEINVSVGDNYVINNKIQLNGLNRNGVAYTKFMQGNGYWVPCDADGNVLKSSDLFDITSKNILVAKKAGNGFITYRLSDEAKNSYISKEGGKTVNPGDIHGTNDVEVDCSIVSVNIK